jgi:hypothetical protein
VLVENAKGREIMFVGSTGLKNFDYQKVGELKNQHR